MTRALLIAALLLAGPVAAPGATHVAAQPNPDAVQTLTLPNEMACFPNGPGRLRQQLPDLPHAE